MNVCVLTHTYPRFKGDPVAPFMKDFCEGLVSCNNNVTLLTPFDSKFDLRQENKNFSITLYKYIFPNYLHQLGYSRTLIGDQKLKKIVYFLAPLMMISSFVTLLRVIKNKKIDVISAHWIVPNGFVAAVASFITRTPLITTVPGSDVYLAKKNILFRKMMLFAAKQSIYVTSNSMRYLDELALLGADSKKFVEIPYGVDIERLRKKGNKNDARRELGYEIESEIILAVGRLVEKKGIEYLIKAMPKVLEKHKNTKLIIIGEGSEKDKLIDIAKNLEVIEAIDFKGKINHDELSKFYLISDLYVAPSVKDSKGNLESHIVALFEAIASSLPVISTKLGVSNEYVIDGKNGYRVEERDEKALATAINKILSSSKDREKMGIEGQKIAQEKLSIEACAKKFNNLLISIGSPANIVNS